VDSQGQTVTLRLSGSGIGTLYLPAEGLGDALLIALSGTDSRTVFTIVSKYQTVLGELSVAGDIKTIKALTTDLIGNLDISGGARSLSLNSATSGIISVGPAWSNTVSLAIALGQVTDVSLHSATAIASLRAVEWVDTDDQADDIQANSIAKMLIQGNAAQDIAGDFDANLTLTATATALSSASIKGQVTGEWDISGNVRTLVIGSAGANWDAVVAGTIGTLRVGQDFSGSVVAMSVSTMTVGGALRDANLTFTQELTSRKTASIGNLRVAHEVEGSSILFRSRIGKIAAQGLTIKNMLGQGSGEYVDVLQAAAQG
jgi:hypothetical protein